MILDSGDFENTPEKTLLAAVMRQAYRDKDINYFQGDVFKLHCELLGLDTQELKHVFLNALDKGVKLPNYSMEHVDRGNWHEDQPELVVTLKRVKRTPKGPQKRALLGEIQAKYGLALSTINRRIKEI